MYLVRVTINKQLNSIYIYIYKVFLSIQVVSYQPFLPVLEVHNVNSTNKQTDK